MDKMFKLICKLHFSETTQVYSVEKTYI